MRNPELIPIDVLRQTCSTADTSKVPLDLSILRARLAAGQGPAFWRTLEEAAESNALREYVEEEFPGLSGQIPEGVDRRSLLKVMAASLAMAGAAACTRQPKETIVPYVRQPENVIPGLPLFYATAMSVNGYARGLLVESHLNRPTKVEGNPDHPASLGATGIAEQASVLDLYDPDRLQTVLREGRISTWGEFSVAFINETAGLRSRKGEGLAVLTGPITSPTFNDQMTRLRADCPQARWYVHNTNNHSGRASSARKIAGRNALLTYNLSNVDVIVSLESDFLNVEPGGLAYARQFSKRRRVDNGNTPCRLYALESSPTVSGSLADHRFRIRSSDVPTLTYQLARACGVPGPDTTVPAPHWIATIAADLAQAKGRSLVVPGEFQPESVHLAAWAINDALGNVGQNVSLLEDFGPDQTYSLEQLTRDLQTGGVETLIIVGCNPVYSAPASLQFADAIRKARVVIRLGQHNDETARLSHWTIPEAHYLETWSDSRAFDGTATIQQPLITPIYDGKSAHEIVTILLDKPDVSSHDLVKGYWRTGRKEQDFDSFWQKSLHDGVVPGTAATAITGTLASVTLAPIPPQVHGVEVVFRPDPTIGDGTQSNNSWLQELPKPQTKITWDNVISLSPQMATTMKIASGDVLKVSANGATIEGPAWILPGHADESVTVHFGYGRNFLGRVGNSIGYNAYSIQNAASPFVVGAAVTKTGKTYRLANTQETQTMAGREPVRAASLHEYKEHPDFPTLEEKPIPRDYTLYQNVPYNGYKWGMVIDLNVCTGCTACVIACQAENNIAVVGKDQVARGRHMHWIRVDRYYAGNLDEPVTYNQPLPCMQCENAPCEVVCPVAATVHSDDGLNQMVYNRCVGTRYCSNNCPYKVRRFNFYLYSDWDTASLHGVRNPDVTVRSRGVMEKCTYCVQRIQEQKIKTEKEGRRIRDGEVLTACQQVCPTEAITFGDLNDKSSRVASQQSLKRNYSLLDDLNTRPRTTYLGYVRNNNDALGDPGGNKKS